jgi:hypothetical protein
MRDAHRALITSTLNSMILLFTSFLQCIIGKGKGNFRLLFEDNEGYTWQTTVTIVFMKSTHTTNNKVNENQSRLTPASYWAVHFVDSKIVPWDKVASQFLALLLIERLFHAQVEGIWQDSMSKSYQTRNNRKCIRT